MAKLSTLLVLSGLSWVDALVLPSHASPVPARAVTAKEYDFVIVGGGPGGLTLADRLTEDPKVSVLVIEAGPFDKREDSVNVPGAWNPTPYLWPNLNTEPLTALNNRVDQVVVGKVVGGGTTVNAMNLLRATVADYTGWEALGNPGWSWNELFPFFKKLENFSPPDKAFAAANNISYDLSVRGTGGPLNYGYANFNYPASGKWWSAAKSVGVKVAKDPSSGSNIGLFWVPTVLDPKTKTRCSARVARYDRVQSRTNYQVLAEHIVEKILFKGNKAIGVRYGATAGGNSSEVFASKEIIVAAGALHTPQVLQLSGIGPEKTLKALGIPVIVNLPGVGSNFQDHASLNVNYNFSNPIFPNAGSIATNATFAAEQRALYDAGKPSAFTVVRTLGSTFGTFAFRDLVGVSASVINDAKKRDAASSLLPGEDKTVIAGYKAQREVLFQQFENPDIPVVMAAFDTFSSVMLAVLKPFSRGRITIKSTNPREDPRLDFRTATDPADLPVFVGMLRKLRQIMSAPDMASLGPTEIAPFGAHIQSDEDYTAALRQNLLVSSAHQCCSAPMMPLKLGGVVDAKHNVYGVTGLRIADVSTFPIAVAGGPTANVYGVAEKTADIVKKAYKLASI